MTSGTNNQVQTSDYGYGVGISRRQAFVTFAIVSLALIMASIDSTIVSVSLPTILTDLHTNLAYVGWTITGYQFSQCILMPLAGKLSDEYGRKRLFLFAVAVFTISSVAAGFAPNIYWLIIFRVIQGAGAISAAVTALAADLTREQHRTKTMAMIGSSIGLMFVLDIFYSYLLFHFI